MSEPLLTKRLHISGLTPSITPADLERRLSSFGKVKAMDGFGALDALGDPRKFGFVTMEIGAKELAKCLNVLSGSTWKGVKLRIGEAKPDFQERLAQTNSQPPRSIRAKRTRSRSHGILSGAFSTPPHSVLQLSQDHTCTTVQSAQQSLNVTVAIPPRTRKANNEVKDKKVWVDEEGDIETVPRGLGEDQRSKPTMEDNGKGKEKSPADVVRFSHEHDMNIDAALDGDAEMEENDPAVNIKVSAQTAELTSGTNLKALFAPKEDAPFSLVDHLDLDLDLELDVDHFGIGALSGASQKNGHLSQQISSTPQFVGIPTTKSATKTRSRVTLDPSLPLLFPTLDLLPHQCTSSSEPTNTTRWRGASSCFLFPSPTPIRGLHHLPSSITFTRSPQDTPESIRERWEEDKVLLTREWKKAWREARGSRRRRVGVQGEIDGSY